MDVTFGLGVDETQSQKEWVTVRMPDGPNVVVLADGSVQQISASRMAAMRQQNTPGE